MSGQGELRYAFDELYSVVITDALALIERIIYPVKHQWLYP
jgi:hypothetical protein